MNVKAHIVAPASLWDPATVQDSNKPRSLSHSGREAGNWQMDEVAEVPLASPHNSSAEVEKSSSKWTKHFQERLHDTRSEYITGRYRVTSWMLATLESSAANTPSWWDTTQWKAHSRKLFRLVWFPQRILGTCVSQDKLTPHNVFLWRNKLLHNRQ